MAHRFGDLLAQYRARRHGLTQAQLAHTAGYDPAVITRMCQGRKDLTGPGGRDRVVRLIGALNQAGVLATLAEANTLLAAADMPPLFDGQPTEAALSRLLQDTPDRNVVSSAAPPPAHVDPVDPKGSRRSAGTRDLPLPLTSFVGRAQEIQHIEQLLDQPAPGRLITLTGPGGVGKTRLATELARRLQNRFAGGCCLASLAPLSDPALVLPVVTEALHVHVQPGTSLLDAIANALQGLRLLLILDNCEHLVGACAGQAAHLLRECPSLTLLATSRETLRVPGEVVFRVQPFATQHEAATAASGATSDAMQSDAVRLFVERAQAESPGFALTDANRGAVAQVCEQLDGLPLAIELAAALVPALTAQEIAARLAAHTNSRLLLLAGGPRTDPPRHQALVSALEWSYNLLAPVEQRLFARLAVFNGGWTANAAEAMCPDESGAGPDRLSAADVLPLLRQLVNKSLVVAEQQDGHTRYRMLETLREYAGERLRSFGKADLWRDRHLTYFVAFAERASSHVCGDAHAHWMQQLETEHANLRAALAWSLEKAQQRGDAEALFRLVIALWMFWGLRNHGEEALRWLRAALDLEGALTPPVLRAQLLNLAAGEELYEADSSQRDRFSHMCEQSLATCRAQADQAGIAYSLLALAIPAGSDSERAMLQAAESLRLFEATGDVGGAAAARLHLARLLLRQARVDEAEALLEAGCELYRAQGDRWSLCWALAERVWAAQRRGDDARASALTKEVIALAQAIGDQRIARSVFAEMGGVALSRGSYAEARAYLAHSLEIALELDDRDALYWGLMQLCNVDHPRALQIARRYLARQQQAGDRYGIACALYYLGNVLQDGGDFDYVQSRAVLEQALVLWRELGVACAWHGGVARTLINLGQAIRFLGDNAAAAACYDESIQLARAANDRHILRPALVYHGYAMLALGRLDEALADHKEVIAMCRGPAGRPESVALALAAIAEVLWIRGDVRISALLAGAASTQQSAIGTGVCNWRVDYERHMAAALQRMSDPTFAAGWEEGRVTSIEQAADIALAVPLR